MYAQLGIDCKVHPPHLIALPLPTKRDHVWGVEAYWAYAQNPPLFPTLFHVYPLYSCGLPLRNT